MSELNWALGEFIKSPRLKAYKVYEDYYNGKQPMAFAGDKFRNQFWRLFRGYSDNMCQSVVDVQAERLEVIGFTSSALKVETKTYDKDGNEVADGEQPTQPNPVDPSGPEVPEQTVTVSVVQDPPGEQAWAEWEADSVDLTADIVHTDIFKFGDAFVIVDEEGVWRQEPSEMAVRYSSEKPGVIEAAAKYWYDELEQRQYLNIYTADGLVKYQSRKIGKAAERNALKEEDFSERDGGGDLPAGIPVVHFPNKTYGKYGISELKPVLPLQDALNKAEMDLIVAMEYQAFRQRWLTGVDIELDEETGQPKNFPGQHGAGNFLAFGDSETKVGEFGAADLKPYVDVIENLRAQIARVTGIPPHYFFVGSSGATVSGETLKVGESRFTRKGNRQHRCIGKGWEIVMDIVLETVSAQDDEAAAYNSEVDLNTLWEDITPSNESEELDVLIKKGSIGVPNSQLQREAGYDPEEVEQFGIEYAHNIKLGVQSAPGTNAQGQAVVPQGKGASTTSSTSQVSAEPGTTPTAD